MLSPRSSMGGESPLKPPSVEASPPQKKEQEEEEASRSGEPAESQKEEDTEIPEIMMDVPGIVVAKAVIVSGLYDCLFVCLTVRTIFQQHIQVISSNLPQMLNWILG